MDDLKFVLHHIGGRAGTRAFPLVPAFEHEFVSVMYEASTDGNDQILSYGSKKGTGKTILVNACVGRPGKDRIFNLNRDPYTSSLLELDPKYKNYYIQQEKFDYVFGQAIATHKKESIKTESLDDLIQSQSLPSCDFLSIDTQGSELEILQHAEKTLENCVGLKLEVSFVRNYKDKPLFGEIDKFLVDRGFHFIRFTELKEWAPLEVGLELRGEKMQFETDAIYFKEPSNLTSEMFYPAVFSALVFGQTEYATMISRRFKEKPDSLNSSAWMKFCDEFLERVRFLPIERKSFDDVFSVEQSFARFVDIDPREIQVHDLQSLVKKLFWRIPRPIRELLQRVEVRLRKRRARFKAKHLKPTELEEFFENVGLSKMSKSLRRSRSAE
ncbi:MAG: FkbM family methyltransferase [Acidimicrobiaceae bacterium]